MIESVLLAIIQKPTTLDTLTTRPPPAAARRATSGSRHAWCRCQTEVAPPPRRHRGWRAPSFGGASYSRRQRLAAGGGRGTRPRAPRAGGAGPRRRAARRARVPTARCARRGAAPSSPSRRASPPWRRTCAAAAGARRPAARAAVRRSARGRRRCSFCDSPSSGVTLGAWWCSGLVLLRGRESSRAASRGPRRAARGSRGARRSGAAQMTTKVRSATSWSRERERR
mmetsp:Transcript_1315/g.5071  ORF Transcript_1315/g.5071 Transcript_1315/m.5071 type:complete len:226 (+) Transcript_1315:1019-1696(+)